LKINTQNKTKSCQINYAPFVFILQLIIKALRLQERLSTLLLAPNILYWGTDPLTGKEHWKYRPSISNSFIFSHLVVALFCLCCIYNLFSSHRSSIPFEHLVFFYLSIVLGYSCIGISIVNTKFRYDYSEAFNHLHEYGHFVLKKSAKQLQPLKKQTFIHHLESNLPGMIALSTALFCGGATLIGSPMCMYLKLDPVYWLPFYSPAILPFRIILVVIFIRESFNTLAMACLLVSFETPIYFHCLNFCNLQKTMRNWLNAYTLLRRIRYINVKACGDFTAVLLGCVYFVLVCTHAISIFGGKLLPNILHWFCIAGTIMLDIALHTYLPNCTKIYDWSDGMIQKWRRGLGNGRNEGDRKELRRMLKAMRPIAFRCGSVGALKQETKRRYFHSIFDGFFDVVMTFRNLWKG